MTKKTSLATLKADPRRNFYSGGANPRMDTSYLEWRAEIQREEAKVKDRVIARRIKKLEATNDALVAALTETAAEEVTPIDEMTEECLRETLRFKMDRADAALAQAVVKK